MVCAFCDRLVTSALISKAAVIAATATNGEGDAVFGRVLSRTLSEQRPQRLEHEVLPSWGNGRP